MKYKFFFISLFLINFNFNFSADFDFTPQGKTLEDIELEAWQQMSFDDPLYENSKKNTISDEILICDNCNKYETFDKLNFKRHVKGCKDLRIYQCKYCQKRFNQSGALNRHVKSVHLKIRDFQCKEKECDYYASSKYELNQHFKNRHSNEKPFKCPYCEHEDKLRSNFKRHLLTQHFFCMRCETQYNSRKEAEACDKSHRDS